MADQYRLDLTLLSNIPQELKDLHQWVIWRYELIDDRYTKVPYNAKTGDHASSTNPTTWCAFDKAVARYSRFEMAGIGFVFSTSDPYFGIDLDDCIVDGAVNSFGSEVITSINGYTEYSPSGRGLKIIGRGTVPGAGTHPKGIGIFDRDRFFTITGQLYNEHSTITESNGHLAELYTKLTRADQLITTAVAPTPINLPLAIAQKRVNERLIFDAQFHHLYTGDLARWQKSPSEADYALCCELLELANGDSAIADQLLRSSGLMRDKWDRKLHGTTYGLYTLEKTRKALAQQYSVSTTPSIKSTKRLTLSELANLPIPEMLIDRLLPKRDLMLLYGAKGSYKTFVGLWLAMQAAQLGYSVLYVAAEDLIGVGLRARAYAQHYNVDPLGFFVWPEKVNIYNGGMAQFINEIGSEQYDLIVFDTYAKSIIGANENDNSDAGLILENLESLIKAKDCTCLIIHHSGIDKTHPRGATALMAGTSWIVKAEREQGCQSCKLEFEVTKAIEEPSPIYFDLVSGIMINGYSAATVVRRDSAPVVTFEIKFNEISASDLQVLRCYQQALEPMNKTECYRLMLLANPELVKMSVVRAVDRLAKAQYLQNTQNYYTITQIGLQYLSGKV